MWDLKGQELIDTARIREEGGGNAVGKGKPEGNF